MSTRNNLLGAFAALALLAPGWANADQQPQSQWDELTQLGQPPHTQDQPAWWKEVQLNLIPEYFYWREDLNGNKILDESGFRIGLAAVYVPSKERGWIWASGVKAYAGSVDYNGGVQLASGETMPLKSTTDYYGTTAEAGYGYRYEVGQNYFFDVLGRVNLDFWVRHLGSLHGYNEYWFPINVKAGVELSPREVGWVAALGLKVPVYTYQTADFDRLGGGTVTLHPKPMVTPYAEAGYKFNKNLSLAAFFDSYWFKQSAVHEGFLQPESKSYQVGVRVGWLF